MTGCVGTVAGQSQGGGPTDVYAPTGGGEILHYNGTAWSQAHHDPKNLTAIHGSGPNGVWVARSIRFWR